MPSETRRKPRNRIPRIRWHRNAKHAQDVWSVHCRVLGVSWDIYGPTLGDVLGRLWRGVISPSALRARREQQRFYRSGMPRWLYDIMHNPEAPDAES